MRGEAFGKGSPNASPLWIKDEGGRMKEEGMQSPMRITLYDPETDEVKQEFTRMFVPWKLLKLAVRMAKSMDMENMTEEDIDTLSGLVVEVFGNRFSVADLDGGADVGEMVTVLNTIIGRARGIGANPTPGGDREG
jgi:hypothetical protein